MASGNPLGRPDHPVGGPGDTVAPPPADTNGWAERLRHPDQFAHADRRRGRDFRVETRDQLDDALTGPVDRLDAVPTWIRSP